ncbi:P-loop containing nucleoside triphosphate hydrolase protein [Cyathus striatus]|nr:P-loop containing nucleoside triphosphate hydrolase protein [Cyathus striatus]
MEVESASRIVDGAVLLIDSVEGVEAQTKGVWKQLDRYGVPTRLVFLNKLDRPGASVRASLASILANRLHPHPMLLTLPISSFEPQAYSRAEPGIEGLVDLVRWEVWKWNKDGETLRIPLPRGEEDLLKSGVIPATHPILEHLLPARAEMLENLSMFSEEFMEKLLQLPASPAGYLSVESSDIMRYLRNATVQNSILPVVCGSAIKHVGTELVLDYAGELLASPLDISGDTRAENALLSMLAWKVVWDKRRGWMTFVRVYSGKMTRQSALFNLNRNEREKATKLLLLYASEVQEVDELPFGSVGVVLGLKFTRTGDTLVSTRTSTTHEGALRDITSPVPMMSAAVIPRSHADLEPVQQALESLTRTDPSVRVDMQEGQLLVHALGALHLEIVEGRLRDEWNVEFELGRRRVSYRESLGNNTPTKDWQRWDIDTGTKTLSVQLHLHVRPLNEDETGDDVWDGNVVVDHDGNKLSPTECQWGIPRAFIVSGVASALSTSPHSSLPLTGIHVKVPEPPAQSVLPSTYLTAATATILSRRIRDAGMGPILEPYVSLTISVDDSHLGKIVKDVTENGGEVLELGTVATVGADGNEEFGGFAEGGVYLPPSWISPSAFDAMRNSSSNSRVKRVIQAVVPLSQFLDYTTRLRALSEGHGTFDMSPAGFRPVSQTRKLEILREIGRA